MKNRFALLLFLGLAGIYLTTCLIAPKDIFAVEHDIILNADTEKLFNQVNNIEHWPYWNDWLIDANEDALTFSRNIVGKGALLQFDLLTGSGELEIIKSERNRLVQTRTFFKNWSGTVHSKYTFEPMGQNRTRVRLKVHNSDNTNFLVRGILYLNKAQQNIEQNTLSALKNLESESKKQQGLH